MSSEKETLGVRLFPHSWQTVSRGKLKLWVPSCVFFFKLTNLIFWCLAGNNPWTTGCNPQPPSQSAATLCTFCRKHKALLLLLSRNVAILEGEISGNSPIRSNKVFPDRLIWMWHHDTLYFPVIPTILQYLPIPHFIYKKQGWQWWHIPSYFECQSVAQQLSDYINASQVWVEQLLTLLTFRCRVLEKIPSFNAQEVKHPPVCGRLRNSGDPKSLSSASLPPQGLAVGHVFPHMAHQPANVDHFIGWEVQEDLLQDIHRDCE